MMNIMILRFYKRTKLFHHSHLQFFFHVFFCQVVNQKIYIVFEFCEAKCVRCHFLLELIWEKSILEKVSMSREVF